MYKILLLLSLGLFVSCGTSKNIGCDVYEKIEHIKIPYKEVVIMESMHIHLEEEHICCWIPKDTNVYYDTLYLEINYVR
jgi:hypothetical protein